MVFMKELSKVFIIAEAGVNHNGKLDLALKLVDAAKAAGADAVKFQTFVTEKSISKYADLAPYQKEKLVKGKGQFEMAKELELSFADFKKINDYCVKQGILFLSTPDEEESLAFLIDLGMPLIKIGSGEVTNLPFLKAVASTKMPIILSTGMATLAEVETAVKTIYQAGNKELALLQAVTEYPTPVEEVNLSAMQTLKDKFKVPVGFSDHTLGVEIALAAVGMGARIIEKHFTVDRNLPGPDHQASLDPAELKQLVSAIRRIEKALGDGKKQPAACEVKNIPLARRGVVAAKDLVAGKKIEKGDLIIKKPGFGVQPVDLPKLIGKQLLKPVKEDEVITWENVK